MRHTKYIYHFFIILSLTCSASLWAGDLSELSQVGSGARILGMGKSFVGMADDCNSLFVNPAGLAKVNHLQLMTMQTRMINDNAVMMMAGVLPLPIGSLAVGYIASQVDDIFTTKLNPLQSDRPILDKTVSFTDKEVLVGYGLDLGSWVSGVLEGNLYGGATLKGYLKDVGIDRGQGSGYGIDIGLLYEPNTQISLGMSQRNAASQVSWQSGASNKVESITQIGMSLTLEPLTLALSADLAKAEKPLLLHAGAEYNCFKLLTLRAGIDQFPDVAEHTNTMTTLSSITLGLGVTWYGVHIDYAYHPYDHSENNAAHFVSLMYGQ